MAKNDMVAVTIGTKVSFAWETEAGVRPITGYKKWCDCTAHPDLNPARDQIETTTLCQENNHTYTSGLRDFGEIEFGSNLTQSTMDLFIGEDGYKTIYESKKEQGLGLWVCIDIKHLNKSYYIPVEPQDFGMPEGEAGSNKYELSVYFSVTGDAGWFDDPIYTDDTNYKLTVSGYVVEGVKIMAINNGRVVQTITTTSEPTTVLTLKAGNYTIVAEKNSNSQVKQADLTESAKEVVFDTFA